jgi:hypothetical protein
MNARSFFTALAGLALFAITLPASTRYMSVDEIRPGMVGVGRTVFEGTKVEEFRVHILGVLRNVSGPRRSMILARLEGGPLADTGVIAGMSGSPVYIDGRMVGAVAYSIGQFSKEPIAGITPIAEMLEVAAIPDRRVTVRRAKLEFPISRDGLASAMRTAFSWFQPFAERAADVQLLGGAAGLGRGGEIGTLLRPIATPLVMGGIDGQLAATLSSAFAENGFLPVTAGSDAQAPAPAASDPGLKPGDAVGVDLVSGDMTVGATGTVTEVDGNRVYAFGHPFYNLGPTTYPMTRAYVHALLPSLASSTKITTTGDIIGTFRQDRSTAISGVLGEKPPLIPITITLDTERGLQKSFKFQVVSDQLFTPLLTYVAIVNTLSSYEREYGTASYVVTGKATVAGQGALTFEDIFTGDSPSVGAATYITAPITFLLGNDYAPVQIQGVDLTIKTSEQPLTAKLERVWLDAVRPRPGQTVPLKLLLRTYRGEEVIRTVPIDIPANASGTLSILVSDGSRLSQFEQRDVRQPLDVRGVSQMIQVLNKAHKNNRLYIKLLSADPGGVVDGEYLSSLPPSVLAVFEADKSGGSFIPLRNATIGEWEIQTDHAVSGSRLLTINIDPE